MKQFTLVKGKLFKRQKGGLDFTNTFKRKKNMVKKAIIEVVLVEESSEKTNKEIEREISAELSEKIYAIPWAAKIEKMAVTES